MIYDVYTEQCLNPIKYVIAYHHSNQLSSIDTLIRHGLRDGLFVIPGGSQILRYPFLWLEPNFWVFVWPTSGNWEKCWANLLRNTPTMGTISVKIILKGMGFQGWRSTSLSKPNLSYLLAVYSHKNHEKKSQRPHWWQTFFLQAGAVLPQKYTSVQTITSCFIQRPSVHR